MPVFDFSNSPEKTKVSECTYTVFRTNAPFTSPDQPILILDTKEKAFPHHPCGIFTNPSKRTSFEFKDEEDQEFARRLFRRSILNADYYRHLISENTRNWDLDRIAFMDVIILQIALAEILSFPNIPVSVSLNEYVDIAKLYSTAKSGGFINGTLDGIVNQLKKENKLTKN